MFNTLFILHDANKNRFWTQIGNHGKYSSAYRAEQRYYRLGSGCNFETIGFIDTPSEQECMDLQRAMTEIFKVWTAMTNQSVIEIKMKPDLFVSVVKYINKHKYNNREMLVVFEDLLERFEHLKWSGQVYFVECENDKLKIGETSSMSYRWDCLKEEDQNKATDIIEIIRTEDRLKDEAMLHLLCRDYKEDGNKERRECTQSKKLSELFTNCQEVRDIWKKYTEGKDRVDQRLIQYYLTGTYPEEE